jgi:hypothetical protein
MTRAVARRHAACGISGEQMTPAHGACPALCWKVFHVPHGRAYYFLLCLPSSRPCSSMHKTIDLAGEGKIYASPLVSPADSLALFLRVQKI